MPTDSKKKTQKNSMQFFAGEYHSLHQQSEICMARCAVVRTGQLWLWPKQGHQPPFVWSSSTGDCILPCSIIKCWVGCRDADRIFYLVLTGFWLLLLEISQYSRCWELLLDSVDVSIGCIEEKNSGHWCRGGACSSPLDLKEAQSPIGWFNIEAAHREV